MNIEADMAIELASFADRGQVAQPSTRWRMGAPARQALAACIGADADRGLPTSYAGLQIEPAADIRGWELVR